MLFPPTIKATKRTIKLRPRDCIEPNRWVWPLPSYDTAQPRIVRHANASSFAVDIGYGDAQPPQQLVPVYAVHDGTIQLARETATGYAMVVDHHGEWSTYYAHLSRMICLPTWDESRRKVPVCAGSLLGFAARETPIRFELWRWTADAGFTATPPEPHLTSWEVLRERDPNPTGAPKSRCSNTNLAA